MLDSENQTLKDILLNANACSEQNMKEAEEEYERMKAHDWKDVPDNR